MSTRRSSRLAKRDIQSDPPTPSVAGGIKKKAVAKVKKIAKAATPSKKKGSKKKNSTMQPQSTATDPEKFPQVQLTDHEGTSVSTKDIADESAFIVFLYPKANTPGCTTQACGLRDNFEELKGLGYRVYGLSYDSPKSQTNWKNKHNLPYSLLCDTVGKGSLIAQLGAHKPPKSIKRSHFVVAKGGTILDKQVGITPKNSIAFALEFAKNNPAETSGKGEAKGGEDEEMKDAAVEKPEESEDKMAVEDKPEKFEAAEKTEDNEAPKEDTEKAEKSEGATKTDETAKPADEASKPEDAEMKPVEEKPVEAEEKPAVAEEKPAEAEKPTEAEVKPAEAVGNGSSEPVEGDTKPAEEGAKPMEEPAKPTAALDEVSKDGGAPKPAEGATEKAATIVTEAVVTEAAKDANSNSMPDVQVPPTAPIEGSTIPDAVETPAAPTAPTAPAPPAAALSAPPV